jgi:hypothetical protein
MLISSLRLYMLAGLLAVLATAVRCPAQTPDNSKPPARDEGFIPLGVYWPGEFTYQEYQIPKLRWEKIDAALDDLEKHGVNAIWLTHLDAKDTANIATRAAKRGIRVVASIAQLAGEVEHIRVSDHKTLIESTLRDWGSAPAPLAWGLGDEPRSNYMDQMQVYVNAWRKHAPGQPVTSVVMWHDLPSAAKVGFDYLAADIYPYFSPGNPASYGGPPSATWIRLTRQTVRQAPGGWMKGQAYQEAWGPFELDEKGNIVLLPGASLHWTMPTPAQIRWQAWSAIATGSRGMFYFLYRWPVRPAPNAKPSNLPAVVSTITNTGSPLALTYPDGSPTTQYLAMGEAFGGISDHASLLANLRPIAAPEAWPANPGKPGDVATMFLDRKTGQRYLMVVADPDSAGPTAVTLGPHVLELTPILSGSAPQVIDKPPFRATQVELKPGSGAIFKCIVDETKLPRFYVDDFTTDRYTRDALNGDNPAVIRHPTAWGMWLVPADAGKSANQAHLIYDLDALFGPLSPQSQRMLLYRGAGNPPDSRGVFWSASQDGVKFEKLSTNEFNQPILFRQRYLKVGLTYTGAGSPHYGHLEHLIFCQWGAKSSP